MKDLGAWRVCKLIYQAMEFRGVHTYPFHSVKYDVAMYAKTLHNKAKIFEDSINKSGIV